MWAVFLSCMGMGCLIISIHRLHHKQTQSKHRWTYRINLHMQIHMNIQLAPPTPLDKTWGIPLEQCQITLHVAHMFGGYFSYVSKGNPLIIAHKPTRYRTTNYYNLNIWADNAYTFPYECCTARMLISTRGVTSGSVAFVSQLWLCTKGVSMWMIVHGHIA